MDRGLAGEAASARIVDECKSATRTCAAIL